MSIVLSIHKWEKFSILKIREDAMGIYINPDLMEAMGRMDLLGKNVIDGGSSIGLFSLYLSKRVGKRGRVYAFEIQPVINELAIDNATLNNRTNITFHNKAISDKSGNKVGFTHIDYTQQNISSVGIKTEPALRGESHCGEVETMALDDLNIENVGLIKLDLEGNEPKALDGMWETIDRCKPYLIVELSPTYLENKEQETIDKIISHGYSVKELSDCNYVFEPI